MLAIRVLTVAAGLSLVGCGGSGEPTADPSESSSTDIEPDERWTVGALEVEPVAAPPVQAASEGPEAYGYEGFDHITAVDDRWVAFSDANGLAVHTSTDGFRWQLAHSAAKIAARVEIFGTVDGDQGLIAFGTAQSRGQAERAVWRSTDRGISWEQLTPDPSETSTPEMASTVNAAWPIDGHIVFGGSVGAGQYDGALRRPAVWILANDGTLREVDVPSSATNDSSIGGFFTSGDRLVAFGHVTDSAVLWMVESSDAGETWSTIAGAPQDQGGSIGVVHDDLVSVTWNGQVDVLGDNGWIRRRDAAADSNAVDRDDWGAPVSWRDRVLSLGAVVDRADENFCFDDVTTCRQARSVIRVSDDLATWRRVTAPPSGGDLDVYEILATSRHRLLIVGQRVDEHYDAEDDEIDSEQIPTAWIYTANGEDDFPTATDEPDEQPHRPKHPFVTSWDADLEVGTTYRAAIPIRGCGSGALYDSDRRYATTEPWPDPPYPDDWPVRHESASDGPTEYLYGTITLTGDDTIEVGIERGDDVDVLRVYEPAPPPEVGCS